MRRDIVEQADASGLAEVEKHWGNLPSFHDGEVIRLNLERDQESSMVVKVMDGSQASKLADVMFMLSNVQDLQLADFSIQNVVFDIGLERLASAWRLTISPCYGITGFIDAKEVRIGLSRH